MCCKGLSCGLETDNEVLILVDQECCSLPTNHHVLIDRSLPPLMSWRQLSAIVCLDESPLASAVLCMTSNNLA